MQGLEHARDILTRVFKVKSDKTLEQFIFDFDIIDRAPQNWIPQELYNHTTKTFTFTRLDRFYFGSKGRYMVGPPKIFLKPDSWAKFPHMYYKIDSQEPISFTSNVGELIGSGNKLPSRPDRPKIFF